MSKKTESKIKVQNSYFEGMNNPIFQIIIKKSFTTKTSYWLARVFDKLQSEAKIYFAEKQKLIEKYAKRHEKDGEGFKKGDIVSDGQTVDLKDATIFRKELNELLEIEVEIGLNKIEIDLEREPSCTVEEMGLLLPLIEVKE